jgi:hypothetical protein
MSKKEKLFAKALANPTDVRFADIETMARHHGWEFDRSCGSHRQWVHEKWHRPIPLQEKNGMAKPYQVRQFLTAIKTIASRNDSEEGNE